MENRQGLRHRYWPADRHSRTTRCAPQLLAPVDLPSQHEHHTNQWQKTLDALDLDLYVPPPQTWWQRLLFGIPAQKRVERATRSLLIMPCGRWPVRHILLVLRAEQSDWATLPWIERLARPGQTHVSLLPVVPAWPRLQRRAIYAQPTPDVLLAPNTVAGSMIRQLVQRLRQQQLGATLTLGSGDPDSRIRAAVNTHDPDLILIAAEPHNRWLRAFYGELVRPLAGWVERPLLIAK